MHLEGVNSGSGEHGMHLEGVNPPYPEAHQGLESIPSKSHAFIPVKIIAPSSPKHEATLILQTISHKDI